MATMLDVFKADGYSLTSLTTWINKMPYVPNRLAGLFPFAGETTTTVLLERNKGKISLIPAKTRGAGETTKRSAEKRDVRPFVMAHLPYSDSIKADDLLGVRAFGTESTTDTVNAKVSETLASLRMDHETTHEYQRIGGIQGVVLDADGSTPLIDLFDEFGISRHEVDFELDDSLTPVKVRCTYVRRLIEEELGATPFTGIEAQCGNGFWDALLNHEEVKRAYDRFQEGRFLREDQRDQAIDRFEFCGIMFENYRGKVGDVPFIPHMDAAFYPTGVPDLFKHHGAPADYMESVNTRAQNIYVKQERMKFDKGIEFESQSNPAMLCSRPEVLVRGFSAQPPEVPDEL